MALLLLDTERMVWVSEVEVTQEMLEAGHIEMKKVAEEQGLGFALNMFSQETIDKILAEGFRGMFNAMLNKSSLVEKSK